MVSNTCGYERRWEDTSVRVCLSVVGLFVFYGFAGCGAFVIQCWISAHRVGVERFLNVSCVLRIGAVVFRSVALSCFTHRHIASVLECIFFIPTTF